MLDVNNLDFNLLRVLLVLLEEKNTHRAAERLGISQPSVSRALAKLREQLGDPLFFREKRGLRLSSRAERLSRSLPDAIDALVQALEPELFDPLNAKGQLKIAVDTFIAETFGTRIYQHFQREAPGLILELFSWSEEACGMIESGQMHMGLNHLPMDLSQMFVQRRVGRDLFGVIGRKGIDLLESEISDNDLGLYPMAGLLRPPINTHQMVLRKHLAKKGIDVDVAIRSQHLQPLLEIMAEEDILMLAPYSLTEKLGCDRFQFARFHDAPEGGTVDIGMIFSNRNRHSPMYLWLEEQLKTLFNS